MNKKQENFCKNIIIGAGIAGLSAAAKLKDKGEEFLIFEKQDRLGGTWRSLEYKGSVYEFGPNTVIDKSEILRNLVTKAGMEDELLSSELKNSKRYFYRNNGFIEISANPLVLLMTLTVPAEYDIFLVRSPEGRIFFP